MKWRNARLILTKKMLIEDLRKKVSKEARHFVDFPGVLFFDDFYDHLNKLFGVEITRFEADGTVEMWVEFNFRDHIFFVDNRYGEYEFYVEDPKCPDEILLGLAEHFRQLLDKNDSDVQELGEGEM